MIHLDPMPATPYYEEGSYTKTLERAIADGAFVGTCLEKAGWGTAVDEERVRAYMEIVSKL